ncbi:MAG TPA: tetratricopeptide repeat protein, partial [Gemmata sp.]|nr:tetratricopeptide repeat protein [Gemmata sp.]
MSCRLCSRRSFLRACAVVLAVGLAAPHAWAWWKLRTARSELEKYHPAAARRALESCAHVWSGRASIHLLACQAARQDGDLPAAERELRQAQRLLGEATDGTALEFALILAADGHVREVEEYLQHRAEQSTAVGPLVWEALAIGYLRVYRTLDAMACLNHWLTVAPDNVRALELRGRTWAVGKSPSKGVDDFRRVLELDPTRKETRTRFVDAAIAIGKYDEAAHHLEVLRKEATEDPSIMANLARCYAFLQRGEEARRMIDDAVAKHPDDHLCLRTRGHLAILDHRPADAEADLRRAAALQPWDYQAQNLLFQALQQQNNKEAEAAAQLKIAERTRERFERLNELQSRRLAE